MQYAVLNIERDIYSIVYINSIYYIYYIYYIYIYILYYIYIYIYYMYMYRDVLESHLGQQNKHNFVLSAFVDLLRLN